MSYQRWKSQASQTVRKFKTTAIELLGGSLLPPATPSSVIVAPLSMSGIRVTWGFVPTAASFTVIRTNPDTSTTIFSGISTESYDDTGLAAVTAYSYTVTAVNAAGSSAASGSVSATTRQQSAVLERIVAAMVQMIAGQGENRALIPGFGMTKDGGYLFDWISADIDDIGRVNPQPGQAWAYVTYDKEACQDKIDTMSPETSSQVVNIEVDAYCQLDQVYLDPPQIYALWLGRILEDLKKLFMTSYGLLPGSGAEHICYISSDKIIDNAGDTLHPGKLKTIWEVHYTQDRFNPNTTY